MKTLIKALLFIITLAFLCHCDKNDPNPSINIPNNNFLNALIELGVDTDGDGDVSMSLVYRTENYYSATDNNLCTINIFFNISFKYQLNPMLDHSFESSPHKN